MRQAILITAYRDMAQLLRLVEWFDSDFEVFIHLDRKCHEDVKQFEGREHVHMTKRFCVEWGDFNHLKAIVSLMREAFSHQDLEFFHLITGSDYPAMTIAQFKAFCEENRNINYVEHFPLPHSDWGAEGGLNRIRYWWIHPNTHRSAGATITRRIINLQRRLGIRRPFKHFDGHLYGGGTYWSVSREAVGAALDYFDAHPGYLRRFRWTSIAEEICLPSFWTGIGMPMCNNYKRYIDWGPDGANPQVLTEKDYDKIIASDALFARKMQSGVSDALIEKLRAR